MKSWVVTLVIISFLLGSCTVMAGDVSPWPAMAVAVVLILALKAWNDRKALLAWPMEFLLIAAVTMIVVNLARLYIIELPS
ncbi:MAG: hypothetical protein U1E62_25420 [Alsobacter sp.]